MTRWSKQALLGLALVTLAGCGAVAQFTVPADVLANGRLVAGDSATLDSATLEQLDPFVVAGLPFGDGQVAQGAVRPTWVLRFHGSFTGVCPKTIAGTLPCAVDERLAVYVDAETTEVVTTSLE